MAATAAAEPRVAGMVPLPFRVGARAQDTADTWTLTLEPLAGPGPSVAPGQFMMATAFGFGEVPISVSGPPGRPGPVVLTVRAVGAVSRAICATEPGGILGLRGPFGNAWPVDDVSGDVLVVAGGIGLAPLRPVVLRALERRDELGMVSLVYGARTPADLLYGDLLDEWRARMEVAVTVDSAGSGWTGNVGVVTKLLGRACVRPEETSAFLCGPEIMMRFAAEALVEAGVAPERVFVSMERHMDCGIGLCGHCQLGPTLICRDGPVYSYEELAGLIEVREL